MCSSLFMRPQLVFARLLRESDIPSGVTLMGSQGKKRSTCRAYLSRVRIEFHINSYQEEKLPFTPYVADMLCAAQCRPCRPQQRAACTLHRLEKHNFLHFVIDTLHTPRTAACYPARPTIQNGPPIAKGRGLTECIHAPQWTICTGAGTRAAWSIQTHDAPTTRDRSPCR